MQGAESTSGRRAGPRSLRFPPPLEAEFRGDHAARELTRSRAGLVLALAAIGVLAIVDARVLPSANAARALAVRLMLVAPVLIAALLATYPGALNRHLERLKIAAGAALAIGTLLVQALSPSIDPLGALCETAAAAALIYLSLGLRFHWAAALAMPLGLALLLYQAVAGGAGLAYLTVATLVLHAAGAFTSYRLERAARNAFLEREVVNVLAGNDGVTGIPNRSVLAAHLDRLHRQSHRERRGLALLLLEIEHFAAFERHYGRGESDLVLRRVARTILRGARRPLDCAARVGGARFALALYDTERRHVEKLAAELRAAVALLDIANAAAPQAAPLYVRVGAALAPPDSEAPPDALLELAADALERAREGSRDGIVIVNGERPHDSTVTTGPWRVRGLP